VFGRPFAAEHLRAVGLHEPEALLAALVRRDLLASTPRPRSRGGREYRFRSPVVRDVAYRMIADGLRRDLHLRLAMLLAATPDADPEETAHHFDRAGDGPHAARWYATAGEAAARRGDALGALRCADSALALNVTEGDRAAVHLLRCDALEVLSRLSELEEAIARALASASTDAHRARALTHRAIWLFRKGALAESVAQAAEAVLAARAADDAEGPAVARGREGVILADAGRLEEAQRAVEEATSLAARAVPRLGPHAATWRAQVAGVAGDLRGRRDGYAAAVRGYEEAGDLRRAAGAAMNLADVSNRVGAYAEAERALQAAVERCRRVGNPLMEGYAGANLGYALLMQGRSAEAL